jgi:nicotinamidase-related amidase
MRAISIPVFLLCLAAAGTAHAQDAITEWSSLKAPPAPELKAVTLDPHKTALLVMDFDRKSCTQDKRVRCFQVLPKVVSLVKEARANGVLVVNFFNSVMTQDDIVPELKPAPGESVEQGAPDKFYGTSLEKTLKEHGIDTIVLAGTSANGTVLATALGGGERKLKIVAPVDTMPADGAWQEQFSIWEIANGPGMRGLATITRSDMVKF